MPLDINAREPDDELHNPDPRRDCKSDRGGPICTARGIENLGCLFILVCALVMLLYVVFCLFSCVGIESYQLFSAGMHNPFLGEIPNRIHISNRLSNSNPFPEAEAILEWRVQPWRD